MKKAWASEAIVPWLKAPFMSPKRWVTFLQRLRFHVTVIA